MAVRRGLNRHANKNDHRNPLYFTVEYAITVGVNSTNYMKVDYRKMGYFIPCQQGDENIF